MLADFDARLDALARRIDASLARSRTRGVVSTPANDEELEALTTRLRDAEAGARLQAQRCQALEDQVVELEAALVGAREQRAAALAAAETARQQADRALDQLEAARQSGDSSIEAKLTQTLQAQLLEVERLSSELASLRHSNDDWRTRARGYRRDLDRTSAELERASTQLAELRARDEATSKRLVELERLVAEQRRELELAERRTKHLRQHMTVR